MELIYAWIDNLPHGIYKQGFLFNKCFEVDHNVEKSSLTIRSLTNNLPDKFWPTNFLSINAILGENGVGKTTLLDYIFHLIGNYNTRSLIVIRDLQNKLYLLSHKESKPQTVSCDLVWKTLIWAEASDSAINTFLKSQIHCIYSSQDIKTANFRPSSYSTDVSISTTLERAQSYYAFHRSELKKKLSFIEAKSSLLPNDWKDRLKTVGFHFNYTYEQETKNNLGAFLNGFSISKIVAREMERSKKENFDSSMVTITDPLVWKAIFVLHTLYNQHIDNKEPSTYRLFESLKNINSIAPFLNEAIAVANKHNKSLGNFLSFFINEVDSTNCGNLTSPYINSDYSLFHNTQIFQYSLSVQKAVRFSELYESTIISPSGSDYIKFHWDLSSGERAMLSLFSRLFHVSQDSTIDFSNKTIWLLLDECDAFFHPDWQRKYIHFLSLMIPIIFPQNKIQAFLTAHSPFILSDIPKNNIVFIQRSATQLGTVGLTKHKQTFAANIHSLYADGFFMTSLTGEFAKEKINRLISILNGERDYDAEIKNIETAEQYINLIGEPILRHQLQKMLDSKRLSKIDEIDVLKKQIAEIQKQVDRLEGGSSD